MMTTTTTPSSFVVGVVLPRRVVARPAACADWRPDWVVLRLTKHKFLRQSESQLSAGCPLATVAEVPTPSRTWTYCDSSQSAS